MLNKKWRKLETMLTQRRSYGKVDSGLDSRCLDSRCLDSEPLGFGHLDCRSLNTDRLDLDIWTLDPLALRCLESLKAKI